MKKGEDFGKGVLVRNAQRCAERTGIPVRVIVDNGPINHCFFTAEARKLGFAVKEPESFEEVTRRVVMTSSKRLRGGW